jgi:hypothetical protein
MITRLRHPLSLTLALGVAALGAACGSTGSSATSAAHTSTVSAATWAHRANTICTSALGDDSHQLVDHLDVPHVKAHGMAIVLAGSQLDALGAPAGVDTAAYTRMLAMYKRSAIDHAIAIRMLQNGEGGNAGAAYAIALNLADRADRMAESFGAAQCDRFGMEN